MKTLAPKLLLVGLTALVVTTTGCFRVGTDTIALRDAVLNNTPEAEWEEQVELGFGRISVAVLQLGGAVVSRCVEVPPEARAILSAAKGAEASVYQLRGGTLNGFDPQKILAEADKKMEKRGWYRLVGVVQERELVAVYVPEDVDLAKDAEVAVLVLNDKDLVCVGARSDLRPLYRIAMEKAGDKFPALAANHQK